MRPALSILLPVRDGATTLPACLDSIRAQTWADFELLAIDDHSQDASVLLLERAARQDPRVRLLRNPGRGLVDALNLGLEQARGDLVARMDADDIMHPERLALQAEYLRRHPGVALAGARVKLFPEGIVQAGYREYVRWQNGLLTPEQIAQDIYVEAPFAHPAVTFRRRAVIAAGGYRQGPFPEDYELWLRLHQRGERMAKLPQTLLYWRESAGRTSRQDPRYLRTAFDRLRADYLARDPLLRARREALVFWGAGRKTRRRCTHLIQHGFAPQAWIDIDPRKIGNRVQGAWVVAPAWLRREPKPLVLVYVANHGARDLIAAQLQALGYRKGADFLCVG